MDCRDCPADDSYWCAPCCMIDAIENTDFDIEQVEVVTNIIDAFSFWDNATDDYYNDL